MPWMKLVVFFISIILLCWNVLPAFSSKYTDDYYRCKDEQDDGLLGGLFMPIRYDRFRNNFWRVQQNKIIGTGIAGKPSTIIRLSEHLEYINEYVIPVEINTY